eukprot:10647450-Ditylum_brightwellii.AAC.1
MDDCQYPAASKMVSREAAITYGTKMLCGCILVSDKCFVPTAEGDGVVAVELPPSEEETMLFQVAADRASHRLKNKILNALEFDNVKLKKCQIDILIEHMDPNKTTNTTWVLWAKVHIMASGDGVDDTDAANNN